MIALALVAAALLGLPLLFTALVYAAWTPPPTDPDAYRMPPGSGARAFLAEYIAAVMLLATRPLRLADERGNDAGAIVFVPESRCSSAAFWLLRRRLRPLGWSSTAGPATAALTDLDSAAAAPDARIARLVPRDAPLALVGHGAGGIVARHYAETRAPDRVRHVVTLGTPHQGTTALPYRLLRAGDLSPGPVSLVARRASLVDLISIVGDYDAWLAPLDTAYCPGGFNITVRGLGHLVLLLSPRVAQLIAENLAASRPRAEVRPEPGSA